MASNPYAALGAVPVQQETANPYADLGAVAVQSPPTKEDRGTFLGRLARNTISDIGNLGVGTMQGVYDLGVGAENLAGAGLRKLGLNVPEHLASEVTFDPQAMQTGAGQIGHFVGSMAVPEARISKVLPYLGKIGDVLATGAGYGGLAAAQEHQNIGEGALLGAGVGGLTHGAIKALGIVPNMWEKTLLRVAPQELPQRALNDILGNGSPALTKFSIAYQEAKEKANNYANLEDMANTLDDLRGNRALNTKQYVQSARDLKNTILAKDKLTQRQYSPVMDVLDTVTKSPPKTYGQLLEHYQTLNSLPSWDAVTQQEVKGMKGHVQSLKNALWDQLAAHQEKMPDMAEELGNFTNTWKAKNADYGAFKQFHDFPGSRVRDKVERAVYENDPNAFNNLFFQKSPQRSMAENWQKYQDLTGLAPEDAQRVLKEHYFSPSLTGEGEVNPQKALQLYRRLDDKAQNWILTPEEQKAFQAAHKAEGAYKTGRSETLGARVSPWGVGFGTAALAHMAGVGELGAGVAGYLADIAGKRLMRGVAKKALTPDKVEKILNKRATQGAPSLLPAKVGGYLGSMFGGN